MPERAVVIGLDGVAWHLLDPLIQEGHMPRLSALRGRGAWGVLDSTVPTYTPPAWTSAVTGVNPGRHGIYGFHAGNAQSERQELMHSGKIKAPALWEIANAQGARVGIYNLPLTYPPQELDGWMVSGMMTPGYGHRLKGFVFPHALEEQILSWAPGYVVELKTSWDDDWRDASLCERAVASLVQRYVVLEKLLEHDPPDVLFTVIETPDRLQHAYYRYMDPKDELYDSEEGKALRPAIARAYGSMDRIIGLLDQFSDGGGVLVCSDHGFTAWETSVHTNTLLKQWGYLKMKPGTRAMQTDLARKLVPVAKRLLPAKVARQAKARTFAAIDWSKTKAFASGIPQQGIFINLKDRERFGIVDKSELDALKDEIAARYQTLRAPDGSPVTDRVWRSEEVFSGTELAGAPDLLPVLRDHRFELDDELFHKQPFTEHGDLPRGVHHPDGMVIVAGRGTRRGASISGSVLDITPTLLYMAGLKVPEGLDGSVILEAFDPERVRNAPVAATPALSSKTRDESSPYSEEEEAIIEESLRGLGYL
jgi:predicted AlkP superfamily phosphohydrolase/phosphomutase